MTRMNYFYILWTETQGIPLLSSEVFKKLIHVMCLNKISKLVIIANSNYFLHGYNTRYIAMHDGDSTDVLCMRLEKGHSLLFSKISLFRSGAWRLDCRLTSKKQTKQQQNRYSHQNPCMPLQLFLLSSKIPRDASPPLKISRGAVAPQPIPPPPPQFIGACGQKWKLNTMWLS